MCFADYYDDVSGSATRNRNEIREKIKTDYKYLPKKVIWKGIYLKLMFFVCLYVSTATKKEANRLDCAWLKLLKGMTRSRWNGHSSLSFKSELLETRSFFSVYRQKRIQDTFHPKNEKLQFRRNYEFAKTWNREENESSQNTKFS